MLRRFEELGVVRENKWEKKRQNEVTELMVAQIFAAIPRVSLQPYSSLAPPCDCGNPTFPTADICTITELEARNAC